MGIGSYLVGRALKIKGARLEKILHRQLENLEQSQLQILLDILRKNQATDFGLEHGFDKISNLADFRRQVPVAEYEHLRPYIEKQDRTGQPALIQEEPIFYAVTSGTTGKPKFIPVHNEALRAQRMSTDFFLYHLLKARPKVYSGRILAIVGAAVEGYMEGSGLPYGSTSGHMYEGISALLRRMYVVPAPILALQDYDLKYRCILRLALEARDITYLSTANPSTIAKLVNLIPASLPTLIQEIADGTFGDLSKLKPEAQKAMAARLRPNPSRAEELRQLAAKWQGKARLQDLWPELQAVGTWTGGSSFIFLDQLKNQFSPQTLLRDLGYLASEFRGSVPIQSGTQAGVPTFWAGFYEFVEQTDWESGQFDFKGLHELQDGRNYYIFITTDYGLYRYHMNDIVRVNGFYMGAPLIQFLQKGKGVTSITGEKLYESQVIQAVSQLEKELEVDSEFYIMSCNPTTARYTLYYELSPAVKESKLCEMGAEGIKECRHFQDRLDEILGEINLEYQAKRKSGRVHFVRVCILKRGAYESFKRFYLNQGQREGQFKIVALQFEKDIKFDFAPQIGWDGILSDQENLRILASTRHRNLVSEKDLSDFEQERPLVSLGEMARL